MNIEDRWADLEAQFDRARASALESEVRELSRAEQSVAALSDRLEGVNGELLRVALGSGRVFEGVLTHVGRDWIQLRSEAPALDVLVLLNHVQYIDGHFHRVREEDPRKPRRAVTRRLEAIMSARVSVNIVNAAFETQCFIDRVGADHVDVVAIGDQRQSLRRQSGADIAQRRLIPLSAVEAVFAHSLGPA